MLRRMAMKLKIEPAKANWIIPAVITALLGIATYATFAVAFSTNDDIRIMYALAGYNTGSEYPYQPFINVLLGMIISSLYKVAPQISWYAVYHIMCMAAGMIAIGRAIHKICREREAPTLVSVALQILLYYVLFLYPFSNMQFSTTPAILGAAAVVTAVAIDVEKDTKKSIICDFAFCTAALLFCFMTRSLTWYCVMCFFALALFYQDGKLLLRKSPGAKKWIVNTSVYLLLLVVFIFGLRQISRVIKEKEDSTGQYTEYNEYRTDYQDYKRRFPYKGNEQFYEEVGWSKNVYDATGTLQYLDERINLESLKKITEAYEETTPARGLQDAANTILNLFHESRIAKSGFAAVMLLFASAVMFFFLGGRKKIEDLLCAVCAAGGFGILLLYLAMQGRLPIRSFMVIVIPAACILLLLNVKLAEVHKDIKGVLAGGAVLLLCGLGVYNVRAVYFTDECTRPQTDTTATIEQFEAFEEYAVLNPDKIYVYDFTVATVHKNPFRVFPEKKPVNCIIAGGSYTYSDIYYKQLQQNNLEQLYWEDLLRKNVYYVSASEKFLEMARANIEEATGQDVSYMRVKNFGEDNETGVKIYKLYR